MIVSSSITIISHKQASFTTLPSRTRPYGLHDGAQQVPVMGGGRVFSDPATDVEGEEEVGGQVDVPQSEVEGVDVPLQDLPSPVVSNAAEVEEREKEKERLHEKLVQEIMEVKDRLQQMEAAHEDLKAKQEELEKQHEAEAAKQEEEGERGGTEMAEPAAVQDRDDQEVVKLLIEEALSKREDKEEEEEGEEEGEDEEGAVRAAAEWEVDDAVLIADEVERRSHEMSEAELLDEAAPKILQVAEEEKDEEFAVQSEQLGEVQSNVRESEQLTEVKGGVRGEESFRDRGLKELVQTSYG